MECVCVCVRVKTQGGEQKAGRKWFLRDINIEFIFISLIEILPKENKVSINNWFADFGPPESQPIQCSCDIRYWPCASNKEQIWNKVCCFIQKPSNSFHQKPHFLFECIGTALEHKYLTGLKKVKCVGVIVIWQLKKTPEAQHLWTVLQEQKAKEHTSAA